MVRSLIGLLLLTVAAPSWAQRIVTEAQNPSQVIQVHTALNHLTVIEAGEPVVTVATGSDAFKVEWRGNMVFVEPTEPNQSTNLFIWTRSGRLNYELDPAGPVGAMDFAIDHPSPVTVHDKSEAATPRRELKNMTGDAATDFSEMDSLLRAQPVRDEQLRPAADRVNISVDDVFEQNDTLYIRYEIFNNTRGAYLPTKPKVLLLRGVRSSQSLVGRVDTQLSEREAERLRVKASALLQVVDAKLRSANLSPGQDTLGVISVRFTPNPSSPHVIRIEFPSDGRGAVAATLVL
ncbi:MAG: TrbG/VirB9 family P-type conjugative transfer protein [Acidobacteria bacterium]|nr:TrbG/VirB9 family P-type conjugative transfer protein [Acidobacteriota bacterium]